MFSVPEAYRRHKNSMGTGETLTMETKPTVATKYDGTLIKLGDKELVVPSLTVKQGKQLWPHLESLAQPAGSLKDHIEASMLIIHAAISRNYPKMTMSQLEDLVDLSNFRTVVAAVMGKSGIQVRPAGEAAPATE